MVDAVVDVAYGGAVDATSDPVWGPWDCRDAPTSVMACDRHWLGSYVHTACAQFHLPPGVRVLEERPDGGDVDGLHVIYGEIRVVVSVHGVASSEVLWPTHAQLLHDEMVLAGADISFASGVGGTRVCAILPGQCIVAAGVDGPRWMVRAVAYTSESRWGDMHGFLDEVLADFVVFRGSGPVGPGYPLDMTVMRAPVRHVTHPR